MICEQPAVKLVSGTADGSLYTGGGKITCIEASQLRLTVNLIVSIRVGVGWLLIREFSFRSLA